MSALVRISLVGFTSFEHSNFETYFRLTHQPDQPFVLTDRIADCRLAVVNADDDAAVAEVTCQNKLGCSLMLGNRRREGAALQLARPINLNLVVRALNELAQREPPVSRAVQRVLDDLAHVTATLAGHMRPREMAADWAGGGGGPAAARKAPPPTVIVMAEPHTPAADLPDATCEAYLMRPLAAAAPLKVVGDRDVAQQAFARTAHTPGTLI